MREHTAGGSHKNGRRLYVKVDGPSSLVLESEVRGTMSSPLQSALDWIYAAGGKRRQDKLCSDSTSKFFISLDVLPVGHRPSTFFETHYWQPFVFSAVARREGILWVEIWVRTNIHAGKQMPSVNWILYGSSQIRHIEAATGCISATNKQDHAWPPSSSVFESCGRLKVTVRNYLADILPGLANASVQRVAELTPAAWAAKHALV